jgi:phospholipase C
MASSPITNVFVVVLENRSFDHMLGWSGITGTDAATGKPTSIIGASKTNCNFFPANNTTYCQSTGAPATLPVDPGHEFLDVLWQLSGPDANYPSGGPYPAIDNSGFVYDYAFSPSSGEGHPPSWSDLPQIMQGFTTNLDLPVLWSLAKQFCVCDQWFSSMPGPTWPNRLFAHGASSAGLDHSPTTSQIIGWETGIPEGFTFPNGSIFDAIAAAGGSYRLYFNGNAALPGSPFANLPIVAALHNITLSDVNNLTSFEADLNAPGGYPYWYTYIEPSYGAVGAGTYEGGSSQHPLDGVANGEALLKQIYQTISASPVWKSSMLIITWDEHGGFYDHVAPGSAVNPGDTDFSSPLNQYQFNFEQYGVRVPAVVVSPLIGTNLIDHRVYDHSSIPATIEAIFGLKPLTKRDAAANNLTALLSTGSSTPRTDVPLVLPDPVTPHPAAMAAAAQARAVRAVQLQSQPPDSGILPISIFIAARHDAMLRGANSVSAVKERLAQIKTRADAQAYLEEVGVRMTAANASKPRTA